jgi:glycosyltransferase involved in cell wall biosynthesis
MKKTFCFVQLYHISERGGGAEVQAGYLSKELASRGFQVHYICQTVAQHKALTQSFVDGVNIHWIPLKPSLDLSNIKLIKHKLLEIQPEFIIERMTSSYGLPIMLAKRKMNSKYIWICTDNKSPQLYSKVKEFYKKLSFLKFVLTVYKPLQSDIIRRFANKKANLVFSQNDVQKQLIQQNYNRDSFKMISGHPLPSIEYSSKEHFSFQTVLWCANFGPHKRPELFIELARQMQHTSLKFVMVGGHGNTAYVDNLLKHKPTNLLVTGQLSFKDALSHFDKASIFVNSSVSEGFSNTYIQAWLRGVPVVVFGADSDKIIEKNQLGFDVTSVKEAVENISATLTNYEAYKSLSENALTYGCQNHSIKVMTDNFLNVIEEKF